MKAFYTQKEAREAGFYTPLSVERIAGIEAGEGFRVTVFAAPTRGEETPVLIRGPIFTAFVLIPKKHRETVRLGAYGIPTVLYKESIFAALDKMVETIERTL